MTRLSDLNIDEQFEAAVNIIKRLPSEGSFRPSNDLKLKFYGLYKQAVEGPCHSTRPGFWDLVNRAKWDAWNKLGHISAKEAKQQYIEYLIQIMKDVNFTESSDSLDDLKEVVRVLGPFVEIVAPKYPILSKVMTNGHASHISSDSTEDNNNLEVEQMKISAEHNKKEELDKNSNSNWIHYDTTLNEGQGSENTSPGMEDSDNEEFSDSTDQIAFVDCINIKTSEDNQEFKKENIPELPQQTKQTISKTTLPSGSTTNHRRSPPVDEKQRIRSEVNEQLALAIIKLQRTMEEVVCRIDSIEQHLNKKQIRETPSWWKDLGLSTTAMMIIVAWPFVAHLILHSILSRRSRNRI